MPWKIVIIFELNVKNLLENVIIILNYPNSALKKNTYMYQKRWRKAETLARILILSIPKEFRYSF